MPEQAGGLKIDPYTLVHKITEARPKAVLHTSKHTFEVTVPMGAYMYYIGLALLL